MKIIALTNGKGGSAKTSSTISLAACLVEKKKKVLLIDLDPQLSATQWLKLPLESKGLFDVFTSNTDINSIVCKTGIDGLDAIPGSPWLISADKALSGEVGAETILKTKLRKELKQKWDYVLIDCPPATGVLSLNALCSAHGVIIPVEIGIMAISGLASILQTIKTIQDRLNPELQIKGILPCRVDNRTRLSKEIIADLRKRFSSMIYKSEIRENIKLKECPSFGMPITLYDSKCAASKDYRSLAKEIIKKEKVK